MSREHMPLAAALLALALLGGCRPSAALIPLRGPSLAPMAEGEPLFSPPDARPAPPGQPAPGDRPKVLVVRLQIITVLLPVGALSESEELWSYVNEEPAGSRRGQSLASNGMRVGVAREDAWPEIARLLNRHAAQPLMRAHMIARPAAPVSIILRPKQEPQSMFIFRPDRTLVGRDYPSADYVLALTAGLNFDDPTQLQISGEPMLRGSERRQRYVLTDTGYSFVFEPEMYGFEELSWRFNVPPRGFIVVGPGRGVDRPSSPGSLFLIQERKGVRFETVLVIAPEVVAAALRREKPQPAEKTPSAQ